MSRRSVDEMMHLLNCRDCKYNEVVIGPSRVADFQRECHEDSIRNFLDDQKHCPTGSVAWAIISDERARKSLQANSDQEDGR